MHQSISDVGDVGHTHTSTSTFTDEVSHLKYTKGSLFLFVLEASSLTPASLALSHFSLL